MNTKDLEIIANLKRLIYKASVELASEYERDRYPFVENNYPGGFEIIKECQDYGYNMIWDEYWEFANNLSFTFDYYKHDGSCEDDITAHYDGLKKYLETIKLPINSFEMAPAKSIEEFYEELTSTFTIEHLCVLKVKLDNYINNSIYS